MCVLRTKLKVKDEDTSNFLLFQLDNVQQSYHFWLGRNSAIYISKNQSQKKKHSHNNKDKAQKIKSVQKNGSRNSGHFCQNIVIEEENEHSTGNSDVNLFFFLIKSNIS